MVKKNPFTKEQGAYFDYIQRWKATGEGTETSCAPWCRVHKGVEPTARIRFDVFCNKLRKLSETEFYIVGLRNEGKTRGGHYPKLVREQRGIQALLLIERDKKKKKGAEEKKE